MRGEFDFFKARVVEREFFVDYLRAVRIRNDVSERSARKAFRPISRFDDETELCRISRPVDAAVGKNIGVNRIGVERAVFAARIEIRIIERASVIGIRHKREVASVYRSVGDGAMFAAVRRKSRKRYVAVGCRNARSERVAVERDDSYFGTRDRAPRRDRLHEYVAGFVGIFFNDDPLIGYEDEPLVSAPVFFARHAEQKETVLEMLRRDRIQIA